MGKAKFFLILLITGCFYSQISWAAGSDPLRIRASALMGYDNNTGLNAERKGDSFAEETVSLAYQKQPSDFLRFRLSSSVLNVNYFESTDQNILLPIAGAGLDILLAPRTVLEADYDFMVVYFPNDISVNSFNHEGRIGLKQVLTKDLIWRGGFAVSTKDFEDTKLRQADGILSDSKERGDLRTIADSELSIYLSKTTMFKLGFNYYWNDSNDLFHDYYDYEGFRLSVGFSTEIGPRVYLFTRFAYENRDYDSRPLVDRTNVFENDDIYTASGGIFYNFNKHFSLGGIYSYRQKNSNEPSQKYSGSISTLGLYYSF